MSKIFSLIEKVPLKIILLCSFLVRCLGLVIFKNQYFPDAVTYLNSGKEIFSGKLLTSHIVMPLYPILTYLSDQIYNVKVLDIVLSTLTVLLVYKISLIIFKKDLYAKISALFCCFYPFNIFYSVSGLTETSFTFFAVFAFYLLYSRKFFWGSVVITLSILIRPSLDLLGPVMIIYFSFFTFNLGAKKTAINLGMYLAIYSLIMTPWWVHNHKRYGEFVRLNLGDGVAWYSGNNPDNKTGGGIVKDEENAKTGDYDVDLGTIYGSYSEHKDLIRLNNELKAAAFKFIKENPGQFLTLMRLKLQRFYALYPHSKTFQNPLYIFVSVISFSPLLLGLIGSLIILLMRSGREAFFDKFLRSPELPLYMFISYLTLVHSILLSSFRYRFPIEPFLMIILPWGLMAFYFLLTGKHRDFQSYLNHSEL